MTDEKPASAATNGDDLLSEEFAAQFAQGMQDLMAGLDKNFPQGPETEAGKPEGKEGTSSSTNASKGEEDKLNEDELMKQFERMLFGGTGLDQDPGTSSRQAPPTSSADSSSSKSANFQDTIAATMNRLKASDKNAKASTSSGGDGPGPEELARLLSALGGGEGGKGMPQMNELLKSLGDLDGDGADNEGIASMLENMMSELMGKEVLYTPMKDMDKQYPEFLAGEKFQKLSQEDKDRYTKQAGIVKELVQTFEDPSWEDEPELPAGADPSTRPPVSPAQQARNKKVQDLMNAMQDCGAPPDEIVGDLPEGMNNIPGLGEDEECTIM